MAEPWCAVPADDMMPMHAAPREGIHLLVWRKIRHGIKFNRVMAWWEPCANRFGGHWKTIDGHLGQDDDLIGWQELP